MLARWLLRCGRGFVILHHLLASACASSASVATHATAKQRIHVSSRAFSNATGVPTSVADSARHGDLHRHHRKTLHGRPLAATDSSFVERSTSKGRPRKPINESLGMDEETPPTIDVHSIEGNSLRDVRNIAAVIVVPVTAVFLFSIVVSGVMEKLPVLEKIPESAWTVFVAVLLGLLVRHLMAQGAISMHGYTVMNTSVLNLGLLPLIIFTSGWQLRRRDFTSQFHIILIYAVLGTIFTTAAIGLGIACTVQSLGYELTMRESFVFASLISAVDPVATLATYSKQKVDESQPLLHTLVFGESVINDAVAIVLFGLFNETELEDIDVYKCSMEVTRLLFGSILFGLCIAGLLIFALRISHLPECRGKTVYVYLSAYFIFCLSESMHFSGIISSLFAGILFRRYGAHHFTNKGRHNVTGILEHGACKADTAVFLLCGASTALINSSKAFLFGCYATVLCLIVRAFAVVGCSFLANGMKKLYEDQHVVTWRHQLMLWQSGLRGGIALVLALEINGEWCAHKATIIDGTFVVIVALLLTCGSTTELFIKLLGFGAEDGSNNENLFNPSMTSAPHALWRRPGIQDEETCWSRLEESIHSWTYYILVSSSEDPNAGESQNNTPRVPSGSDELPSKARKTATVLDTVA